MENKTPAQANSASWSNIKNVVLVIITIVSLVGSNAITWGNTLERVKANSLDVAAQEAKLDTVKDEFHRSSLEIQTRLTRIETQLVNVEALLLEQRESRK